MDGREPARRARKGGSCRLAGGHAAPDFIRRAGLQSGRAVDTDGDLRGLCLLPVRYGREDRFLGEHGRVFGQMRREERQDSRPILRQGLLPQLRRYRPAETRSREHRPRYEQEYRQGRARQRHQGTRQRGHTARQRQNRRDPQRLRRVARGAVAGVSEKARGHV